MPSANHSDLLELHFSLSHHDLVGKEMAALMTEHGLLDSLSKSPFEQPPEEMNRKRADSLFPSNKIGAPVKGVQHNREKLSFGRSVFFPLKKRKQQNEKY